MVILIASYVDIILWIDDVSVDRIVNVGKLNMYYIYLHNYLDNIKWYNGILWGFNIILMIMIYRVSNSR